VQEMIRLETHTSAEQRKKNASDRMVADIEDDDRNEHEDNRDEADGGVSVGDS
jgi:hypothetical protein